MAESTLKLLNGTFVRLPSLQRFNGLLNPLPQLVVVDHGTSIAAVALRIVN